MRAHKLLSPHRGRQGAARVHAGTIVTQAPERDVGHRRLLHDDGWGWIFTAVEHWNAECVGWHVCKVGSRFAALEPIAQGLRRIYGALDADSARGLALRMDHGRTCPTTFSTRSGIGAFGPATALSRRKRTAWQRWNVKEAIHGRIFQNNRVRGAVQHERLEKLGYHTPIEAPRRTSYAGRRSESKELGAVPRRKYNRWSGASGRLPGRFPGSACGNTLMGIHYQIVYHAAFPATRRIARTPVIIDPAFHGCPLRKRPLALLGSPVQRTRQAWRRYSLPESSFT